MLGLGGYSDSAFVKRSLYFSITGMVFMAALLSLFLPEVDQSMSQELRELTAGYYDMTGQAPTSEEIWGLTGIYTPYGTGEDGRESTQWGTTADGWVYGSRIVRYHPSQMDGLSAEEAYTVYYDDGLYYYIEAGSDLDVRTDQEDPSQGTLYTSVAMDAAHKSDVFFTPGGRVETSDGMYYDFSGWRYVFQPLRDYRASDDLNVTRTTTSLSIVWYDYYGDEGLSGQLMLSGGDAGISYITEKEIVESFSSASYSSRFQMLFNGININVYIKINPYALQFGGYSVAECFKNGFWSVMVTSPSVTSDSSGFTLQAFSPDRVFDIVVSLLTFSMDGYGLTGVAAILVSIFFTVSLYTSLIAIGLNHEYLLIFTGILAAVQAFSIL